MRHTGGSILHDPEVAKRLSNYIGDWLDINKDRISSFDSDALKNQIPELEQLSIDAGINAEMNEFSDANPGWKVQPSHRNDDRNMLVRADGNARITAHNRFDSTPAWTAEHRQPGTGDEGWMLTRVQGYPDTTIQGAVDAIPERTAPLRVPDDARDEIDRTAARNKSTNLDVNVALDYWKAAWLNTGDADAASAVAERWLDQVTTDEDVELFQAYRKGLIF